MLTGWGQYRVRGGCQQQARGRLADTHKQDVLQVRREKVLSGKDMVLRDFGDPGACDDATSQWAAQL